MIKLYQYKKICSISKKIIDKFQNSLNILSINELHIIRPHPVFLKNYYILFKNYFYIRIFFIFIKNLCKILLSILINSSFTKNKRYSFKKYKYIFFSHLFNINQANNPTSKDIYFSHICENLNKNNYCIVYLNHIKKNILKNDNKIFLDINLSFYREIKIFFELIFESLKLFKKGLNQKILFDKKFYLFISANCLSVSTLSNLRIFYQSYEIIRNINPKKITVTYEGHAFERNILRAANLSKTKTEKVAFHHSLPFDNQFSYTINFENGSNPNVILASGQPSYKKLKKL